MVGGTETSGHYDGDRAPQGNQGGALERREENTGHQKRSPRARGLDQGERPYPLEARGSPREREETNDP